MKGLKVLGVITEDKTPYEDVYQDMNRTAAALFGGRVIKLTGLMLTDRKAKARLTQTPCSEDPRWNLLQSAMRDNPARGQKAATTSPQRPEEGRERPGNPARRGPPRSSGDPGPYLPVTPACPPQRKGEGDSGQHPPPPGDQSRPQDAPPITGQQQRPSASYAREPPTTQQGPIPAEGL
ncbi:hypothetical protein SRHO_G00032430 [Serrasalmus rhombeus]